jgi:hypothetical protein
MSKVSLWLFVLKGSICKSLVCNVLCDAGTKTGRHGGHDGIYTRPDYPIKVTR